jgi:oxalate decarboxylase/phosphoglucose isomerase-like protein (cupin superfamily)
MPEEQAIDADSVPTQTFDWGAIKWFVTPDSVEGAGLTFGEVVLMPGRGHDRHNHPESEEILYVLSGKGEQMLEHGDRDMWFPVKAGDTIYVRQAQYHSTVNRGWEPMRLLALYNPGGAEKALAGLPDFKEVERGALPSWTRADT